MTEEVFVQAITEMTGLLPEMVQSLTAMAPHLSETEREEAIAKLIPLHTEILAKQMEIEESSAAQDADLKAFKADGLPKIKAIVTAKEQSDAEAMLEQMNAL